MIGRPTKYDPRYCTQVIRYMAKGYSKDVVAAKLGISRDTLYEWCKAHQEFSDTIKVGEAKSLLFWEKTGIEGMMGKIKGFRPAVWIFVMKNRFGWRDIVEVEDNSDDLVRQESQEDYGVTLERLIGKYGKQLQSIPSIIAAN